MALLAIGLVLAAHFRTAHLLRLAGGSLLASILLFLLGHQAFGLKYPRERTGLFLMFLFPLAFMAAADVFERCVDRWRMAKWAITPGIAIMAAVLVIYVLEFHTGDFAEWSFAPDVNAQMEAIRARSVASPVRMGSSPAFS